MQVDIKDINGVTREIGVVVEPERVDAAYQKYLGKAAKELEVPGFRKGKAPLGMVQKLHSDKIRDYFEKNFVDDVFNEVAREHDIHFLLYPEVKELNWNPGEEMTLKFEIEHEPQVEIAQVSGLEVPYRPLQLEQETLKFILELTREHATVVDVETAADGDQLSLELNFAIGDKQHTETVNMYAGDEYPQRSLTALTGKSVGDKLEAELTGRQVKLLCSDAQLKLSDDDSYSCQLEVNQIGRYSVPALDDEFAKDMDFADLEEMKAKVADDLRLKVEHRNYEGENSAIIFKLFSDNKFSLPPRTMRYILDEQTQDLNPKHRELLSNYYLQNIIQEMTTLYILKALKKQMEPELSDEMFEQYIEHLAILEDMTPAAFKDSYPSRVTGDEVRESALNYNILRKIASDSTFVEPPAEPELEAETETESQEEKA